MPARRRTTVLVGVALVLVAVGVFVLAGGDDGGDRVQVDAAVDDGDGDPAETRPLGGTGERVGEPVDSLELVVTIEPATSLTDGQVVTVSGEGFLPSGIVGWSQCWQDGLDRLGQAACDARSHGGAPADGDGNLRSETTVWRTLFVDGREVDCAVEVCIFAAGSLDDLSYSGTIELDFDPDAPLPAAPALAVSPTDGLRHGDVVTVTIDGLVPEVHVAQCLTPDELELAGQWCAPTTEELPVAGQLEVSRVIWREGRRIDCAEAPGTCEVVVFTNGRPPPPVPLAFDPSVPPPPMPTLTVTPSADLVDGQQVEATLADEGGQPYLTLCAVGSDTDCVGLSGDGVTVRVPRRITVYRFDDGPEVQTVVDCLDPPGCEIVAHSMYGVTLRTSVTFDPDAPLRPDPTITVSPNEGLTDGAEVTVRGDGFLGQTLFIVQCAGDPLDDQSGSGDQCDLAGGYPSVTPIDGRFEIEVPVSRRLDTANGQVDCAETPCFLGAGSSPDDGASSEPLRFAP